MILKELELKVHNGKTLEEEFTPQNLNQNEDEGGKFIRKLYICVKFKENFEENVKKLFHNNVFG